MRDALTDEPSPGEDETAPDLDDLPLRDPLADGSSEDATGTYLFDKPQMPVPGEEPEERETVSDEDLLEDWAKKTTRRPYNERYYTRFGFSCAPAQIDLDGVYEYLTALRPGKNNLTQARDNRMLSEYLEGLTKQDNKNIRYCDFCGGEILGIEYETLADGRDRCMTCSRTAIKTGEEFQKLFNGVKHDLESYFNIKIRSGVRVEMVNSRTLHKRLGNTFTPTAQQDGRTLGVAIRRRNRFSLLVENGSPRMATMLTVAHELTHIWQYTNWNDRAIRRKYGKKLELEVYEGMAKWVEVQYAWLMNEAGAAKRMELETLQRPDPYGRGFIRYRANYPFVKGVASVADSPFLHPDEPLSAECCLPLDQMYILPPELPQPIAGKRDRRRDRKDWLGSDRDYRKRAVKGARLREPGNAPRFAYRLLKENEKALCDRMEAAVENYEPEITGLDSFGVTTDSIDRITSCISYDRPDLFWLAGNSYSFNQSTRIVSSIRMTYNMSAEEAAARRSAIDDNLADFTEGITDAMSDFEVVLKAYENIIKQIDYDSIGLEKQEKERERDKDAVSQPDDLRSIYGVFVKRKAVCAGYARATQYILNRYGIECAYYSNGEHAWNIVNLEGDYYHLDTTWGDATNTKPEMNGPDEISYDCFCITDADVRKLTMHYPNPEYPAPKCTATQCNYYRRFGAYFEEYDFERIRDLSTSIAANGSGVIAFRCADKAVYDRAEEELIGRHRFSEILQFINLKTKVRVDTAYSYVKRPELLAFKFYLKKF